MLKKYELDVFGHKIDINISNNEETINFVENNGLGMYRRLFHPDDTIGKFALSFWKQYPDSQKLIAASDNWELPMIITRKPLEWTPYIVNQRDNEAIRYMMTEEATK